MSLNNNNNTLNSLKDVIDSLVSVINEKDPFMKGHAERVAANCVRFSRSIGLSNGEINQIYLSGLLHDIGIVYIPKEITRKSAALNDDEMEIIKKHPLISEKIVSKHSMLKELLPNIRHHHEFFDGSGYPDGIKGEQIPLGARIINIVNAYDSMVNTRENIPAMRTDETIQEMKKNAGKQFDKTLVDDFISFINPPESLSDTADEKAENNTDKSFAGISSIKETEESAEKNTAKDIIGKVIKKFKRGDVDLPVLPKVVQEIRNTMSQPNATVDTLASVIERDAVISVRLISVSNSPMYRGSEKISHIRQAIPRLGIKETQAIVNAIANKGLYEIKSNKFKSIMETLWLHSLATAYASKSIARRLVPGEMEKYFLMGLIHDIGKVLLLKVFGELEIQGSSPDLDEVVEGIKEAHTGFGSTILRQWGFSEDFARVALLHEGPVFKPAADKAVLVVNLAGEITKKLGFCVDDHKDLDISRLDSIRKLELETDEIDDIEKEIRDLMEDTSNIF
jgi:HD-GYP domain-containing protein (c-di-GMP phosphodiesterase class II)